MKEALFLERLAENLLEGGFLRAMKPRLQPVQIAKALVREMDRGQIVGAEGPIAPNDFVVTLHPDDLATFSSFQSSLERELAAYIRGYAARRGLRTLSTPMVRLAPADPTVPRGRLAVRAAIADAGAPLTATPDHGLDLECTAPMPVVASAEQEAPPRQGEPDLVEAFLLDESGARIDLRGETIAIGRAVDNDIVLESPSVSRHHARIEREGGRYILVDLGSTNGTFVESAPVSRHRLQDGDRIIIGDSRFTFHLAEHLQ